MGIKGLSTFIFANQDFLKPFKLHDSYVVIDGDNLMHPLYFNYTISVMCGGDYNKYASFMRKYFSNFPKCNIQPIVVFDGGNDKFGRKQNTVLRRARDKLASVKHIVQHEMYNKKLSPILAKGLFISILNELNIPFVVSDYEADDQITILANYYKCPVVSADSDFFISDLHNGFIMLDSIETTVIRGTNLNGKKYKYLNCYIYCIDEFLSHFPGIEKNVLPLLGTLVGNDYVEQSEFDNFSKNAQLPEGGRIISLLKWLKGKSLNDAMTQILSHLEKNRGEYIKTIIENLVASCDVHESDLRHIINQKLNYTKDEYSFHSGLITPCGNSLPLDFIIKFHSGHYFSYFANVIVLHKLILKPQIEDFHFPSSYMCARSIRRVIYGILIRHDVDGVSCKNENCLAPIEEYDRHEGRIEKEIVEPIFDLEGVGMLPKINDLRDFGIKKAKLILMRVLDINLDFLSDLPAEWQFFMGAIKYWLCNSFPHCTEAFLYSLIISFIYHEVINYDESVKNLIEFCSSRACSPFERILYNISQLEIQNAQEYLKRYLSKPFINHDNPLCVKTVHCYSQLQSCLESAISLNKLLGTCMANPDIHEYLNGSLLYNLTKVISIQENPKLFIDKILGKRCLSKLFTLLYSKICHDVPSRCILKNVPLRKSERKSSKYVDTSPKNKDFYDNTFHVLRRNQKI